MASENPLNYPSSRNIRDRCDGMCEKCSSERFCPFSHAGTMRDGYGNSSDEKFNSRMLDAFQFQTRYKNNPREAGFSNPSCEGSTSRSYSSDDYRKELGISDAGGFHGDYGGGGGYSGMTPKAGKSSYCGSGCKGK